MADGAGEANPSAEGVDPVADGADLAFPLQYSLFDLPNN